MLAKTTCSSPVGRLMLIASESGLRALLWERDGPERFALGDTKSDSNNAVLKQAVRELGEYFSGRRRAFDVPLDPVGTPFQFRVWRALSKIPYGETLSYGEQARMIGQPQASRAVGSANGKNPISIIVPCHRVIGKGGALAGFGGGLDAKQKLLEFEGVLIL